MSFTSKIKSEIISYNLNNIDFAHSQLYGMLLFGTKFKKNIYTISSENKMIMDRLLYLMKHVFPEVPPKNIEHQKNLYTISFRNKKLLKNIPNNISIPHFLSGVFLICGSITNPLIDYHLEFNVESEKLSQKLISSFNSIKTLNFNPKNIKRRNHYSVYIKENEKIADFLALIGANTSAMEFMQIKMIKEVRNNINRTTNFETANLSKITSSSSEHVKSIKKIIENNKLSCLPSHLRETAILRLKNPYISLKELSTLHKKAVSKSGVNHRLKKLIEISKKL